MDLFSLTLISTIQNDDAIRSATDKWEDRAYVALKLYSNIVFNYNVSANISSSWGIYIVQ